MTAAPTLKQRAQLAAYLCGLQGEVLLVDATDILRGHAHANAFANAFAADAIAADAIAADAIIAVMVASPSALGLIQAQATQTPPDAGRTDAFAQAARWASTKQGRGHEQGPEQTREREQTREQAREHEQTREQAREHEQTREQAREHEQTHEQPREHAPAASPAVVREIAALAQKARRVLVEPELSPTLRNIRPTRTALDRAITSMILHGATAHPLLFVDERRAPKNGLAKLREERILDAHLSLPASSSSPRADAADPRVIEVSLLAAALATLREAAAADSRSEGTPMPGKDLLREARARRTKARASASDSAELAKHLVYAWFAESIDARLPSRDGE